MSDRAWVEALLVHRLGAIGKAERGYQRIAYSDADWEGRELLANELKNMGMSVRTDSVGNIIARVEGTDPEAAAVACGSHSDTVPAGGTYDGSVGVVGAMCALRRIMAKGRTRRPMEIWIFAGHESSRFGFNHLGSKSITGIAEPEKWAKRVDIYGKTVEEVLAARGYNIFDAHKAQRKPGELRAFLEMHIEQGPVLEAGKLGVGIVTDIAAPIRLNIKFCGVASHSGTTPMDMRSDALVAASKAVLAVRERCSAYADQGIVGTIGRVSVQPGVMNCVPGDAEMIMDLRGRDFAVMKEVTEKIYADMLAAAEEEKCRLEVDVISTAHPVHLDDELQQLVAKSAEKLNVPYTTMVGGGGHDTMNICRLAPCAVIHIPCRDGVSHAPEEFASVDDIMTGIDVLTEVIETLANEE